MAKKPVKREKTQRKTKANLPPLPAASMKPAVDESSALKEDLLYLVKLAISLTKEEPDIARYTAVVRALSALKAANEILMKDAGQHTDVICISPATIAIIEEEILGIRRTEPQSLDDNFQKRRRDDFEKKRKTLNSVKQQDESGENE